MPSPRPAIIGLAFSVIVILALVMLSEQKTKTELGISGDPSLPPRLFPMFPDQEEDDTQISLPLRPLVEIHRTVSSREVVWKSEFSEEIVITNISPTTLRSLTLEEMYDSSLFDIIDTSEAEISENKLTWHIDEIGPGEMFIAHYTFKSNASSTPGTHEVTAYVYGQDIQNMTSASRMTSASFTIISMPETGAEIPWILRVINSALSA